MNGECTLEEDKIRMSELFKPNGHPPESPSSVCVYPKYVQYMSLSLTHTEEEALDIDQITKTGSVRKNRPKTYCMVAEIYFFDIEKGKQPQNRKKEEANKP